MNLDVLIPSLLLPAPMHKMLPPPQVPALERLLARADRQVAVVPPGVSWLCERWGMDSPYPIAPLLAEYDGIDTSTHAWMFAEPFHHAPEQKWQKLSPAHLLELTVAESADLITTLNAHFADRALTFSSPTASRWYVCCNPAEVPQTTPLNQALFGSPLDYQPTSLGSINWRAIQNEAQMLLYSHPVNAERETSGKPLVSGVWFWGGGAMPTFKKPAYDRVIANTPLATQLARNSGIDVYPLTWNSVPSTKGSALVVLDSCADFARDHDLLKWAQELERLDREWFLPISTALGNGSIERLTIHSPLADWTQTFQLTRRNYRFRFWRASKPLGSYA